MAVRPNRETVHHECFDPVRLEAVGYRDRLLGQRGERLPLLGLGGCLVGDPDRGKVCPSLLRAEPLDSSALLREPARLFERLVRERRSLRYAMLPPHDDGRLQRVNRDADPRLRTHEGAKALHRGTDLVQPSEVERQPGRFKRGPDALVRPLQIVHERCPAPTRGVVLAHLGRQLGKLEPEAPALRVIVRERVSDGVEQPKTVRSQEPATRRAGNPSCQADRVVAGGEVMIERLGQGLHVVGGLVLEVAGCPAMQILAGGSRQAAQRSLPDQVVCEPDPTVGIDDESGGLEFSDRGDQTLLAPGEEPAQRQRFDGPAEHRQHPQQVACVGLEAPEALGDDLGGIAARVGRVGQKTDPERGSAGTRGDPARGCAVEPRDDPLRERRPALAVERPELQPFDRVGSQDGVECVGECMRGRRRPGHGNEGECLPLGRGGPDQEVEECDRQAVDPLQVVDGEDGLTTSERGMGRLEETDRLEWLRGVRPRPQEDPQSGSSPLVGQPTELDADGRQWDVALRL